MNDKTIFVPNNWVVVQELIPSIKPQKLLCILDYLFYFFSVWTPPNASVVKSLWDILLPMLAANNDSLQIPKLISSLVENNSFLTPNFTLNNPGQSISDKALSILYIYLSKCFYSDRLDYLYSNLI
jgi:hypothetical protein